MGFDGLVVVSDPYLQRRFTQADLRALQQQVHLYLLFIFHLAAARVCDGSS